MNIEGRTVLITGANRGIGAALTVGALGQGAEQVFALVRDRNNMSWCTDKRVTVLQADIRNFDEVQAASKEVPQLDVIINNAGILRNQPIVGGSDAALNARDEIEVNYLGTLNVVNAFWKTLTKDALDGERKKIINVMSTLAKVTYPFCGTYCASKYAVLALTRGLRAQLSPLGVDIVEAYPGLTDTGMTQGLDHLPKVSASDVATAIIGAVSNNLQEVYVGADSEEMRDALARNPEAAQTEADQYMPEPLV
jgi:NAD(P)-dependent dehydrogenase (short-subunit alcohol dehydrogenase family)